MSKRFSVFLSALFCLFLGGMLALSILLPDREKSELENRSLQQAPALSLQRLWDGKFMADAEDYAEDQLAGRDLWVALQAWCERLSGKRENNGVYFGGKETLLNRVKEPEEDKLVKDMESLDRLVSNVNVPVYFGLIPPAAEIWSGRLPAGAPTADERTLIDRLYRSTRAETIDLYGYLSARAGEDIYYRTDHHWTSRGAYYGYAALMEAMGLEALPLEDMTPVTVTEDFNGTSFSTSGVRWLPPDSIQTYVPDEGTDVTSWFFGSPEAGSLYVPSYLEQKDKYSYFLGGVQALCVVRTQAEGPRVLLLRDSYSDSLTPFLTRHFSEIHLMDLRYNRNSVKDYVEENGIDQVVVLYSVPNFLSDQNLFLLGK